MTETVKALASNSLKTTSVMLSRSDRIKARVAFRVKNSLNAGLRFGRAALFLRRRAIENPQRIIVHLIGNVGDIVVAIPALIALREHYPNSHLTLLTSAGEREKNLAGAADLLRDAQFLDQIESYATEDIRRPDGILKLLKRLRGFRPDLMVMLPPCDIPFSSVVRNLLFARLTGARFGVGYEHINMRLFPFAQAQSLGLLPSEITRNLKHLSELGIAERTIRFGFGTILEEEKRRIDDLLEGKRPFVAVCPGGKQVGRRWPAERFAQIAGRLRDEWGLSLIAVGSGAEHELCERVLAASGGGINLAGEMSLRGTIELLSKAEFLLTNDTGPMHLAAAVNTKVVAIFGTRDFAGRWLPFGDGHEVFRAVLNCRQCLFAVEESDHCVKKISVEEVYAGCLRVLQRLNYRRQNELDEDNSYLFRDRKTDSGVELNTALTTID